MMQSGKPNILIVYPPNSGARSGIKGIHYPLGIGYIAAVLEKCYNIFVHDMNCDSCLGYIQDKDYLKDILKKHTYDYLLIGGVFPNYKIIRELINISRDLSSADIILGGSYLKPSLESLSSYFRADYYVLGEGEETIKLLLNRITNGNSVNDLAGIAYHDGDKFIINPPSPHILNLDEIPFPARHLFSFNRYKRYFASGYPLVYSAYLIASRGCSLNCIFCNPTFGRKVRVRSPENILDEIGKVQRDYNCHFIYFYDELLLGGDKNNIARFCEHALSRKGKPFFWGGTTNAQILDEKTLKLMKRAGCIRISFGVESGSRVILQEMRKKNDLEHLKKVISCCNTIGIEPDLSLLTNTFSETAETLKETRDYLLYFNQFFFRQPFSINYITPIPGTDIYDEAKKRGLIDQNDLNNLLNLVDGSRYRLQSNLTNMEKGKFTELVDNINREIAQNYYSRHRFQKIFSTIGNLTHFRLKETILSLDIANLRPLLEGFLWSLSRGDEQSRSGSLYKKMVYR